MFCPTCGRDNSVGRKFCASCGTNLELVSQALSASDDNFFPKIDTGLDHFLGDDRCGTGVPADGGADDDGLAGHGSPCVGRVGRIRE